MLWQVCMFGEEADEPRLVNMRNPNWDVATEVVNQNSPCIIFLNVLPRKLWKKIAGFTEQNRLEFAKI
jgi:hypothetical protein